MSKKEYQAMRIFTYIAMTVALVSVAISCTEESEYTYDDSHFETSIELGLNDETITLDATLSVNDEGTPIDYCVIPVYSNTSWSAELVGNPDWASIDKHSGKGCDYIYFTYTSNTSPQTDTQNRSVILRLETANKRVEMLIVQLGADQQRE